jgi:hypothetical protein
VRAIRVLAKTPIVLGMSPDPEPLNSIRNWYARGALLHTNADATEASAVHGFESKGGVRRILLEKGVVASGEILNVGW